MGQRLERLMILVLEGDGGQPLYHNYAIGKVKAQILVAWSNNQVLSHVVALCVNVGKLTICPRIPFLPGIPWLGWATSAVSARVGKWECIRSHGGPWKVHVAQASLLLLQIFTDLLAHCMDWAQSSSPCGTALFSFPNPSLEVSVSPQQGIHGHEVGGLEMGRGQRGFQC